MVRGMLLVLLGAYSLVLSLAPCLSRGRDCMTKRLLIVATLLLSGCASYNRRWTGRPSWAVRAAYGKPDEVISIDDYDYWYYQRCRDVLQYCADRLFKIQNKRVTFAQSE